MNGDPMCRPLIGITADLEGPQCTLRLAYAEHVWAAGGLPVVLPPVPGAASEALARLDGLVLTGGDDPDMTAFGEAVHAEAKLMRPERQAAEMALLDALDGQRDFPVLGICLGMQLMGLHAGAQLEQHLPDVLATAADHRDDRLHWVDGDLGKGQVCSRHHQALATSGRLDVVARARDGVIEAVRDGSRPFYLGVQWHPERTEDSELGPGVFRRLVAYCRGAR